MFSYGLLACGFSLTLCAFRSPKPTSHTRRESHGQKRRDCAAAKNDSLLETTLSAAASDRYLFCDPRSQSSRVVVHLTNPTRDAILSDYQNKISPVFHIPPQLRKRVGFWFDVYTKFPSYVRILHDARYPWIVYERFDLTKFLVSPHVDWMNIEAAERYVNKKKLLLQHQLLILARRRSYRHLPPEEQKLYNLLAQVRGPRRWVFRNAAYSIRIQTGQRDFYVQGLARCQQYITQIEQIFFQQGVPVELTRLPLVESSFNPLATSKVGASGIWQFMRQTARRSMRISPIIDERRSPLKSSFAAARYLNVLYRELYHSWPLAIMAYNHGPTGLRRIVRIARTRNAAWLINHYRSRTFNFASQNYYPEFLAALYAQEYHAQIFKSVKFNKNEFDLEPVRLYRPLRLRAVTQAIHTNRQTLAHYNLDLKLRRNRDPLLPRGYTVYLPPNQAQMLETIAVGPHRARRWRREKIARFD